MSFTKQEPAHKAAWILVFIVMSAYVAAIAHGVMTIDVARDLFWGIEIARGHAWPLIGPPIGSFEWLSAIWYYVVAVTAGVSSSLTMYFALLGALAALKFVLIYRVALRWMGSHFAISSVIAATVPGIVSYQFFGISHTQFVEVTIWATALFALRLRASPAHSLEALGLGVCAALSLHAHPTAILLLPWAAVAVWTLPRQYRVRAALTAFIASALVFFPFFVALASGVPTGAENIPAASGLRGSVTGLLSILQNLFWFQPTYVVETIGPMNWVSLVWTPLWSLLLILTLIGAVAVMAATDHRWRSTFWATLGTLFWVLVAVTLLRDHTPFYMLYVALPPLTMLYALAWTALRRAPSGGVAATGAVSVVVALHLAVCWGYVHMARYGLVASRLPLHSNMQNTATTSHLESTSAAPTRDAVGRWLCGQKAKVALHGDLAATYDIGLGQEQFFHCRDRAIVAAAGGTGNAWTGLPLPVWRQLSVVPTVVLGTYGLVSASTVASPVKSLRQVSGRAYPPRFAQMIAAAGHTDWRVQVQTDGDALLVVSSLMPTYPQFSVTASLAGVAQRPIARFANTFVFRCVHCAALPSNWEIAVRGGAPETTSITALNPAAASASLGP